MDHVYKVTINGARTNDADRVVRYFADRQDAHDYADSRRSDTGVIGVRVQRLRVR